MAGLLNGWTSAAAQSKTHLSWEHIKVGQEQIGIVTTSLLSRLISLHSPSTNHQVYPFESFTLSLFDKMLGRWYPEFIHIHVFIEIHRTINNFAADDPRWILYPSSKYPSTRDSVQKQVMLNAYAF